jgi:hypothetical protein
MIDIKVVYTAGGWKRNHQWEATLDGSPTITSKSAVLDEVQEDIRSQLQALHRESFPEHLLRWHYEVQGHDITASVERVDEARKKAQRADQAHKAARLKLGGELRGKGLTFLAIGELLGYVQSSVASFMRDRKPDS